LYSPPNIIRCTNKRGEDVRGIYNAGEEMRNAFKIFVIKPEKERPLGRPRNRWEDKIKMILKEIGFLGVD